MKKQTLEQFIYANHTKGSAKSYMYTLDYFIATNPKAEKYNYKDLVNYMGEIAKRYNHSDSVGRILSAIKRYYDYLIAIGKRNDHPCKTLQIKGSRNKGIQLQQLFTSAELEQLFTRENRYENLRLRNKIILSFLVYQGLTSEEITRLDVDSIDFDYSTVYVKATHKLSRRTLLLNGKQLLWINDYVKEYRHKLKKTNTTRLLISHRGDPESVEAIGAMLEPMKLLFPDKTLNPKVIRQSVIANWLNEKKIPLEDVQLMAGHKWPSTTERYRRKNTDEQRELINKFHPLK